MNEFIKNETRVDSSFVCCATCRYWNGNFKYIWPNTIIIDQSKDTYGVCNNTYYPNKIDAFTSCNKWESRYN